MIKAELIIDTDDDLTLKYDGKAYCGFKCLIVATNQNKICGKALKLLDEIELESHLNKDENLKEMKRYLVELRKHLKSFTHNFKRGGNRMVSFKYLTDEYDEIL